MTQHFKDYSIHLAWSDDDEAWIANIPDVHFCAADGQTPQKALSALEETFEVLRGVYDEDDEPFPEPAQHPLPTSQSLRAASQYLKISRVAEAVGLNPHTIQTKLKRGTPLKEDEAKLIRDQINKVVASAMAENPDDKHTLV